MVWCIVKHNIHPPGVLLCKAQGQLYLYLPHREYVPYIFQNVEECVLCCRYAGLIVFSDVVLPRRPDFCNATLGFQECLDGRCYRINKKCDGVLDCEDGTDEANCK